MKNEKTHYLRVGDYLVDAESLLALEHECVPPLCRDSGSCCAAHDVWVDAEDRARLLEWLPAASRYATHIAEHVEVGEEVCRRLGPELHVVGKQSGEMCLLAYRAEDGAILCSLHSAALDDGADPAEVKPRGCILWPLCVSGDDPPVISVQPGADDFPCNELRSDRRTLHPGTAALVRTAFGERFLGLLRDQLNEYVEG